MVFLLSQFYSWSISDVLSVYVGWNFISQLWSISNIFRLPPCKAFHFIYPASLLADLEETSEWSFGFFLMWSLQYAAPQIPAVSTNQALKSASTDQWNSCALLVLLLFMLWWGNWLQAELQWRWGSCRVFPFFKESWSCADSCPRPEKYCFLCFVQLLR